MAIISCLSSVQLKQDFEIMKFLVFSVVLLVLAVSAYAGVNGDGQPGCKTENEIEVKVYRNLWDPTAYWQCSELGKAASAARCPDEEAFVDSLKKCVPWTDWEWEPLHAPPSTP